ncbi:MAG: hypothetical protein HY692_00750 [Cyanobacteria bacterium NC_groundwater_1444_Ag_S-0.65um_54_12]|nr:hypothetical protein [Cyanobacteria bacterium NC_groundwater_1444_Ag_S-0.65um_54_12]
MNEQQLAVSAIVETIPWEIRTSGRVPVIIEGVMNSMRLLAPAVIWSIVSQHGPVEPLCSLQLMEADAFRYDSRPGGP